MTQTLLEQGYGAPRYVSVEQRIYDTKNTYYDVLYRSQRNWHDGKHSIWPWVTYATMRREGTIDSDEGGRNAVWKRVRPQ